MKTKFIPEVDLFANNEFTATDMEIENEPMLHGASIAFAREKGGELTKTILTDIARPIEDLIEQHSEKGYHPVIDTKCVMLMPGFYPCIPGWHCDGVIRDGRNAQPDLSTLQDDIYHFTSVICSNPEMEGTEFMNEDIKIDVDVNAVWQSVDKAVTAKKPDIVTTKSGNIIQFTRGTLHRCPPAEVRGWRYFFRLSFYHMPVLNRFRNQVQVYADINKGW